MQGGLYNTYRVHLNHVITIIMTLMLKSTKISHKLGTGNLVSHSGGDARVKVKDDCDQIPLLTLIIFHI